MKAHEILLPSKEVADEGSVPLLPALRPFGKDIWIVAGPDVRDMGFTFSTRMTVVKLANGSVWVESPVSVSFDTLRRITELGPVRYLVAATPRHVWRLHAWHILFPEAQLWAARTTPFTVTQGHLPITGILADAPYRDWADDLDQLAFKGSSSIEEVLFFHRESRTVILNDLFQIHPTVKGKFLRNALFRLGGVASPYGGVSCDIRLTFRNRDLARQSLARLLSWDFEKAIIAHGPCIEKEAKPPVARAFRWLAR
jgi:hypothetical protein